MAMTSSSRGSSSRGVTAREADHVRAFIEVARETNVTAQEVVLSALRDSVLAGVFEPGARLRQEELADIFQTSRIPVREALRALEYEGLVRSEPHRGFTVTRMDADEVEEIYDLRILLESHAVRLALPLLTDEDLDELEQLMEDPYADPAEINRLLEEIGEKKIDEFYCMAMVDPGNAERLNDLIDNITRHTRNADDADTMWPGMQKLNDVLANGLAHQTDAAVAGFADKFLHYPQGAMRWALIADSDLSDGRTNALAVAYYGRLHEQGKYTGTGITVDPYLIWYGNAFGEADALEQFDAHSTGSGLEAVLDGATPEQVERFVGELTSTMGDHGYPLSEDDYKIKAKLYGEALQEAIDRQDEVATQALLAEVERTQGIYLDNHLAPAVHDALKSPKALAFIVQAARRGEIDADTITDAFKAAGGDIDINDLVKQMIEYEATTKGYGERRLADDIGYLLGTGDLLGQEVKFDGVVKSLLGSLVGAATKSPIPGATLGVLQALYDEVEQMEKNEEEWADSWSETTQHDMLTFLIHTKTNGSPPGYEEWLANQPQSVQQDPSDEVTDYMKHLENARNDTDEQELSEQMQEIEDWIYSARHHSG